MQDAGSGIRLTLVKLLRRDAEFFFDFIRRHCHAYRLLANSPSSNSTLFVGGSIAW